MNAPVRISRALIVLSMIGMICVSAAGFFALRGDLLMLQRISVERIEWKASQFESEFAHFAALFGRHLAGDPAVSRWQVGEAQVRLARRVEGHLDGISGERIAGYDTGGVLAEARSLVARHAPMLSEGAASDGPALMAAHADLMALMGPLRDLSRRIAWGEEIRFHDIRAGLERSSEITLTLCLVAMALAAALVGALLVEVGRHRREAHANLDRAQRATAASRAKSRFLTMMSHELRTPMNGVLGLIALARQSGLTDAQARLLEQADRSGRQMIAQLSDILDFAEFDADGVPLERSPFEIGALADALAAELGPIARRDGVVFRIDCRNDPRLRLVSDRARLTQIARHLASFLLERVAVNEMELSLSHVDGVLTMAIEADEPPEGAPGWRVEAALGGEGDAWKAFESDAFGPMIARSLIERFGGALDAVRSGPRRAGLEIRLPMEAHAAAPGGIRIEVTSATMHALCVSLLARLGLPVWDPAEPEDGVRAVLVEPEAACADGIAALQRRHPGARIVMLGTPPPGIAHDAALPRPPSCVKLREALCGAEPVAPAASAHI